MCGCCFCLCLRLYPCRSVTPRPLLHDAHGSVPVSSFVTI
uniref:Uncharacterized protein n=1 Tax=Anguilla anguilla TaxID=7936 RepID=A0A0E9U9P7_ANGAN